MEAVLLVIHLIVALGIIVTILVQPSESGGFMGNSGSMSNLMMQRRSGDVMTRTTTILAGIFFLTSLLLAISANNRPAAQSILDVDTGEKKVERSAIDTGPDAPVAGMDKPQESKTETAPEKTEAPAEGKKPVKKPK